MAVNVLNLHRFISGGRFLIKLQVRGTALLEPVVKDFEEKKILHTFEILL